MAGRQQGKRRGVEDDEIPAILRIHRAYREDVIEFAELLGCQPDWLATHFEELTLMHIHEQGMHKNLAAWQAWRVLNGFFRGDEDNEV